MGATMMLCRLPTLVTVALVVALPLAQAGSAQADTDAYRDLLAKYVSPSAQGINLVDYARWHRSGADMKRLGAYLVQLQSAKPSAMRRGEAFAYWINLYNAATLKVVLDHYPVKSIRDIKSEGTGFFDFNAGPWRTKLLKVEGRALSLDAIEHNILRRKFRDPRIHYALNCASLGCPNLKTTPWTAGSLEADLDAAARAYINHPRGVSVGADGLRVSSIYHWYSQDFGGSDSALVAHFRKYADPPLLRKLKSKTSIAGHAYDWALNDQAR
jgi:hypothetical protein